MVQFEKHFVQDLKQDVKIRQCGTIVFNADNESNIVSVDLYNGEEPAAVSGSVVGAVICSDGSTVPVLNGSFSGNTVSITLTKDCFAIPGQIGVGIQVVNGDVATTVLKAVYNVDRFTTDYVVDPGSRVKLTVSDLVDDINNAVTTIPAYYTDLMAAIAPNYTQTTYTVGQFAWNNGVLYVCTTEITEPETWTAAHWARAQMGTEVGELKIALDNDETASKSVDGYAGNVQDLMIGRNGLWTQPSTGTHVMIPVQAGDVVAIKTNSTNAAYYGVLKAYQVPTNGQSIAYSAISEFTARLSTAKNTSVTLTMPADAVCMVFNYEYNGNRYFPDSITVNGVNVLSSISVADDKSAMLNSTTQTVLVKKNGGDYGNNGTCLFSVHDGWSVDGYTRTDGSVVFPMAGQGVQIGPNAPMPDIYAVLKSWAGNSNVTYSQTDTLYNETTGTGIDCSAFVTAMMMGVTYDNSRYVLGNSARNRISPYYANIMYAFNNTYGWRRMNSRTLAMYFAEHGQLYELPSEPRIAATMLRPGDILFSASKTDTESDKRFYSIDHCMMVLYAQDLWAIVAEAGVAPNTFYTNESTVCKTAVVQFSAANLGVNYCVFARPSYNNTSVTAMNDADLLFNGNGYDINMIFTPNMRVNSSGAMELYRYTGATVNAIRVVPGATLRYTGTAADDNSVNYVCAVTEYDRTMKMLNQAQIHNSPLTLTNNTRYIKVHFGHTNSQAVPTLINDFDDCKITMAV